MHRTPELDGLRGLAAATIVVHHLWPETIFWGWAAVDLFFLLSGYLITGIILKHSSKTGFLGTFYLRRGLRIWPIYYLTIVVLLLLTQPDPWAASYYMAYFQNVPSYWGVRTPVWHELVHAWTLALEEQFYILWPALLLLLSRPRNIAIAALAVVAMAFAARMAGWPPNLLISRCDGFALGGLLACLYLADRRSIASLAGFASFVAGLLALAWSGASGAVPLTDYRPSNVTASTLLSFALLVSVVRGLGSRHMAWLRTRPLVYLGTISYGLYLYHYPIILRGYSLTIRLGIHHTAAEPFLFGFLSLVAAIASWHFIEEPFLRIKDRFKYGKDPASEPEPSVSSSNRS